MSMKGLQVLLAILRTLGGSQGMGGPKGCIGLGFRVEGQRF